MYIILNETNKICSEIIEECEIIDKLTELKSQNMFDDFRIYKLKQITLTPTEQIDNSNFPDLCI